MANFVAATIAQSSSSSSLTLSLPSGVVTGDLLIATMVANDNLETITPPAGWTAVDSAPVETGSQEGGVWYRFYTSGMSAPAWNITQAQKVAGAMVAFRGVDQGNPMIVGTRGVRGSSSTQTVAPGVTTTDANQQLIGVFLSKTTDVTEITTGPSGMTERAAAMTTGGGATTAHIYSQTVAAAAATGTRTIEYDMSSSTAYGILLALRDSSTGGASIISNFTGWGMPIVLAAAQAAANFPGDPGAGNFYIGWSLGPGANVNVPGAMTNPGWPAGKVSSIHDYSSATNGRVSTSKLDQAISRDMIPSQSFKFAGYTPAQIVAGEADADIDISASDCLARAPWPIWLCYYHEPEDNLSTNQQATEYRAAYRRIVSRFRAAGVTNVGWMPIYMSPWTFRNASGRDWRWWHADWNGSGWHSDIMMDMLGLDIYNPLPGSNTNNSFEFMLGETLDKVALSSPPTWDIIIAEFGMSWNANDPAPPNWVNWSTSALPYAIANRVKCFSYWDNSSTASGGETGRYSFGPTYDPTGNKLDGWRVITDAATVWQAP